jgi:[NiFe] hydrogenase large subunit
MIRNLLHGAQFQHDHLVHFYHLHALDWVDIVSALKADPKKTAALADNVSNANVGGAAYFKSVQQRLQTFVDSGQLGPFANAYWGHPAYKLPPEANLMAVPITSRPCACRPRPPACTPSSAPRTPTCSPWWWAASPA